MSRHLARFEITPLLYAQRWFFTLFADEDLPLPVSAGIWDFFLLIGLEAVFRVGLAFIKLLSSRLARCFSFASLLSLLQHPYSSLAPKHKDDWRKIIMESYEFTIDRKDTRTISRLANSGDVDLMGKNSMNRRD